MATKPRILALDIETFSMELLGWGLYDQNFGLNQIQQDWTVASWAAKFVGEKPIYYKDVSRQRNKRNEVVVLKDIWNLINECDVLLTQNGKSFDIPKLYAKFIEHNLPPLADKEHIDTKRLAKGKFKFTSNSLEYLCKVLGTDHQKLKHNRFPGMELWRECLKGNVLAWKDMKKYNIHDVLCLEDVYLKLRPWGIKIDLGKYTKSEGPVCSVCTGTNLKRYGYAHKGQAKYQRYRCNDCGALVRGKENLLSKSKKAALKPGI
jgi:DNA polymerase elongation subunit (family B)